MLAAAMSGCGGATEGNGDFAQEQRMLAAFDAVAISDVIQADVTVDATVPADRVLVTVSGDRNLLQFVTIDINRFGALEATTSESTAPRLDLKITFHVQSLIAIAAFGSSKVVARGISANHFDINANDNAILTLSGMAEFVDARIYANTLLNAQYFVATDAYVYASDSAHANVCVANKMSANADKSSRVDVYCEPATMVKQVSDDATVQTQ
jgi:hypothetical protein